MLAEKQHYCLRIQPVPWETLNYLSNNVIHATATKPILYRTGVAKALGIDLQETLKK
jgi:hypothetical protein